MEENKEKEIKEKELVIARLEVLLPELCFASGDGFKSFSRDEMIQEVEQGSEEGKEFIRIEMEFLRAFKDGSLIKRLNEVEA
ncbi:MAG: hypothetical protein WA091_03630 [Minisyncoccales bacterium]